jgi:ketosteroid isomerase-like protein
MVGQSISKCRILTALLLAGVVAFQTGTALAQHHNNAKAPKKKTARQAVEALEEQWRVAQLAGDASAMDKLLADDFVGITAFGVTTKAQQLARVRDRIITLTQLNLTDIKVKLIGPVAVVTSRAEIAGTNEGASIKGVYRYTRVYQHLASGAWKITSFEATREGGPRNAVSARGSSETTP